MGNYDSHIQLYSPWVYLEPILTLSMKKINSKIAVRSNSLISALVALILMACSGLVLAQAPNAKCILTGTNNTSSTPTLPGTYMYSPTGGQDITCMPVNTSATTPETIATAGVTAPTNTTQGNNVTLSVAAGTIYTVVGSTIGLGSGATVNNSGALNTSSFYNGYGISAGANGRSQAGGNTLINNGSIVTGGGNAAGIYVSATNAGSTANTLTNAGTITTSGAGSAGMRLNSGASSSSVINTITNSGTINTSGTAAYGVQVSGIGSVNLTNTGTITTTGANSFGIYNTGNIISLTNSQGGSNPLTYSGILPLNYFAKVADASSYGKLDISGGAVTGVMNFNISSNSALAYNTTYATVLNGFKINNLGNSYGTFTSGNNTYAWALVHRVGGPANQTDLVIKPLPQAANAAVTPSAVLADLKLALAADSYIIAPTNYDTQAALTSFGASLQGLFAMQSAGVINGMSYDCPLFGNRNVCVSAGGRYTNVSGYPDNTTSALVIGAYRFSENLRFGGYLDQSISQSTPGGIAQLSNGTPMVGVFGVWNQNTDGTGLEAKLAAGYASKNATLTRPVVGVSEPGSGSTALTSQGTLGVLKYGFSVGHKTIVSPYVGMRYLVGGMNGYAEAQSSTVSSPLTYSAINNYTTTTLAGLIGAHRLDEKTNLIVSAGAEKDVNASVGNLITSGNGEFNIAMNNNYRTVRPTASLGIFYDLSSRERLGLNGIYRQEAYQAVTSTTVMATYTVGL
jgi:hypothetical protein